MGPHLCRREDSRFLGMHLRLCSGKREGEPGKRPRERDTVALLQQTTQEQLQDGSCAASWASALPRPSRREETAPQREGTCRTVTGVRKALRTSLASRTLSGCGERASGLNLAQHRLRQQITFRGRLSTSARYGNQDVVREGAGARCLSQLHSDTVIFSSHSKTNKQQKLTSRSAAY